MCWVLFLFPSWVKVRVSDSCEAAAWWKKSSRSCSWLLGSRLLKTSLLLFREPRQGFPGHAFGFCVCVVEVRWSRTMRWGRCGSGPHLDSGPQRWLAPPRRVRGPGTGGPSRCRLHYSQYLWQCWGSPGAPPAESSPGCLRWLKYASSWEDRTKRGRNKQEASLERDFISISVTLWDSATINVCDPGKDSKTGTEGRRCCVLKPHRMKMRD